MRRCSESLHAQNAVVQAAYTRLLGSLLFGFVTAACVTAIWFSPGNWVSPLFWLYSLVHTCTYYIGWP